MAKTITTAELFKLLRYNTGGHFFRVTFECRTPSHRNPFAPAGRERTMLCRTGVNAFKKGKIDQADRDAEDFRHGLITVWSVTDYHKNIKHGMTTVDAAFDAWRRIDLITVKECSLVDDVELPPEVVAGVHHITNEFRLKNMRVTA